MTVSSFVGTSLTEAGTALPAYAESINQNLCLKVINGIGLQRCSGWLRTEEMSINNAAARNKREEHNTQVLMFYGI